MTADLLDCYAKIGAALFPCVKNTKRPIFGWKDNCSKNPAQWQTWARENPDCNWGMNCLASGLIVIDIDVKNVAPAVAWQEWAKLCMSWGHAQPLAPTVQTQGGGWHVYTRIPTDADPASLSQRVLVKGVIETRVNGFVLIPPSEIDGRSYAAYH